MPDCLVVITAIVLEVTVFNLVGTVISEVCVGDLSHVRVMLNFKAVVSLLGANEGQDNDIGVDTAHEDTNDLAVVVARCDIRLTILVADDWGQRELSTDG